MTTTSPVVDKSMKSAASGSFHAKFLSLSLTVKDLQKSLAWYQEVMGFVVERKYERDGKLAGVTLRAGEVTISINQDDGAKGWERVKGEGFSLRLTTEQNIDEIANRIKKAGGTLDAEPKDMAWGSRLFRLRDPDGFKISISSPRKE